MHSWKPRSKHGLSVAMAGPKSLSIQPLKPATALSTAGRICLRRYGEEPAEETGLFYVAATWATQTLVVITAAGDRFIAE